MAKNEKKIDDKQKELSPDVLDTFELMGYEFDISDNIVRIYNDFKLKKDRVRAGPLTAGEFATVAVLGDMLDGKFNPEPVCDCRGSW